MFAPATTEACRQRGRRTPRQEQTITVSDAGEFGLIARVTAGLETVATTLVGPGDDAAVLATPDNRVVVSTDLLIENRHFRRDWSTAEDVGHKAAARAFSDITAMGPCRPACWSASARRRRWN